MTRHHDVHIIGAGMSSLAAGTRLGYYGRKVRIVDTPELEDWRPFTAWQDADLMSVNHLHKDIIENALRFWQSNDLVSRGHAA